MAPKVGTNSYTRHRVIHTAPPIKAKVPWLSLQRGDWGAGTLAQPFWDFMHVYLYSKKIHLSYLCLALSRFKKTNLNLTFVIPVQSDWGDKSWLATKAAVDWQLRGCQAPKQVSPSILGYTVINYRGSWVMIWPWNAGQANSDTLIFFFCLWHSLTNFCIFRPIKIYWLFEYCKCAKVKGQNTSLDMLLVPEIISHQFKGCLHHLFPTWGLLDFNIFWSDLFSRILFLLLLFAFQYRCKF